MQIPDHPFQLTEWQQIAPEIHQGITGTATWKILQLGPIRIRMVEYSAGYLADHWCNKGHIIYCISGSMVTELKDGSSFEMNAGMSYQVGDNSSAHRTSSKEGVTLFIVD